MTVPVHTYLIMCSHFTFGNNYTFRVCTKFQVQLLWTCHHYFMFQSFLPHIQIIVRCKCAVRCTIICRHFMSYFYFLIIKTSEVIFLRCCIYVLREMYFPQNSFTFDLVISVTPDLESRGRFFSCWD